MSLYLPEFMRVASPVGAGAGAAPSSDWTASDTWTITGDTSLVNAPREGANLMTDPGIEAWTSPTNPTSYAETLAGTSAINQETTEIHGGSNAAALAVDASNSTCTLSQALANLIAQGQWAVVRAWLKNSTTGKSAQLDLNNQGGICQAPTQPTLTTEYAQYTSVFEINNSAGNSVRVYKISAASSSIYADDLFVAQLNYADLFALKDAGAANYDVRIGVTKPVQGGGVTGSMAGVVLCADNLIAPTGFVAAMHCNSIIYLIQYVSAVASQLALIATGTAYVAGAQLRMTFDGSVVKVYYNGAQVGTAGGYSINAALTTNTIHGVICPSQGVTLDSFLWSVTA